MRGANKNTSATIWRRATQLLAALFVLYALADVSILQDYSGNETIGIPSLAQQQLQTKNQDIQPTAAGENTPDAAWVAGNSGASQEDQIPSQHSSEESCFGCCSHILLSFNLSGAITREVLLGKITAPDFFNHQDPPSDSHLRQLFQPPKSV